MIRFLLLIVLFSSFSAGAQPEAEARTIMPQVAKAVKALLSMSAKATEAGARKVQVPGASRQATVETSYDWSGEDRVETYTWKSSLKLWPLGAPESDLKAYYDVINAGLDSLFPGTIEKTALGPKVAARKLPGVNLYVSYYASKDYEIYNGVFVYLNLTSKTTGIRQLMVDSVKRQFYRDADKAATRKEIETARDAFAKAIELQNFSYPLPSQIYTEAVKEKAYNNADVAADMLLNSPSFVQKPTELVNLLQPEVAAEVRVRAKKILDDYNAYMAEATATASNRTKPTTTNNVTTAGKKKTYANACEEEMDGLKYKVGDYVVQGSKVAMITAYDCTTDKYMMAWIDRSKDKAVVELVMKDVMTSSYTRGSTLNGLPFICSACNGFGYLLAAETKQMFNNPPGTLTVEYTTGKTKKIGCGTCKGRGHIKSR